MSENKNTEKLDKKLPEKLTENMVFKSDNIHIHKPSILKKRTIFEETRIQSTMETLYKNGMSINTKKPPFIIKRTYPSGKTIYIKEEDLL